MSLRDELVKAIPPESADEEVVADCLLPWFEQKLSEAQAEMVERCAEALSHLAAELRIVKDGVSADLAANAIQESTEVIRALSPDPHYIERQRVRAKGDAAFECLQMSQAEILEYFDTLRGQLVALPEVKQ